MKKMLTLLLTALLCLSVAGCAAQRAPSSGGVTDTTVATDTTAATTTAADAADSGTTAASDTTGIVMPEDIPPMEAKVEIIGVGGVALPYYIEMVCFSDGMLEGDGALMFQSVPNHLPHIADRIPSVDLGDAPAIRATAREGVSVSGGETVDVYGEDYAPLEQHVPIAELVSRGSALWAGRTVYVHFNVRFKLTDTPGYVKSSTDAYFIKTTFPSP